MLAIRLQRIGRKKSPSYRLVISEKARDTQGRALEILGHYNPTLNPKVLEIKKERVLHWLSQGAQASNAVHNLLVREGIVEGTKQKSVSISKKRQGKIDEKAVAAEEAKKAAAEATKQAEEEVKEAEAAKEAEDAAPAEEPIAEVSTEEIPVASKEPTAEAEIPEAPTEEPAVEEKTESDSAEATPDKEVPAEEKKEA